jgi:hypothetical protein
LLHFDRASHPSVSSFFNTDDTKEEYNASEPIIDRKRWLDQFVHLMGHTGNYTREEAIAAIDKQRTLPDVLSFDPSEHAKYPNGRVFTDDVINYRIGFLTKNQCQPTGLKPRTDIPAERGQSTFDARHRFTGSYIYDLPFGRGRMFGSNWSGITNQILGGWQTDGILMLQSGNPPDVQVGLTTVTGTLTATSLRQWKSERLQS